MRAFFVCLITAALLNSTSRAQSQKGPAEAKALYEQGMVHYQLSEYDAAIDKWQAGFRIRPAPEFLYNIAQAYRLSSRPEKALTFYQKYLSMLPEAPNRNEVEHRIAELRTTLEEQKKAASSPPTQPLPTPPMKSDASPSSAAAADSHSFNTQTTSAPPRHDKPVYKKAWFWGTIVGVAAVAAVGITLGVVLGTSKDAAKSIPDVTF